jgi:hypothetical protein
MVGPGFRVSLPVMSGERANSCILKRDDGYGDATCLFDGNELRVLWFNETNVIFFNYHAFRELSSLSMRSLLYVLAKTTRCRQIYGMMA